MTASLSPRKVWPGPFAGLRVQDRVIRLSIVNRRRARSSQTIRERGGGQVGKEAEPARVDAEDRGRMVFHPSGRMQHGSVAAQHEGDVGRQVRKAGVDRQIDPGQNNTGGIDHGHCQPIGLRSRTSSREPLPRSMSRSGGGEARSGRSAGVGTAAPCRWCDPGQVRLVERQSGRSGSLPAFHHTPKKAL